MDEIEWRKGRKAFSQQRNAAKRRGIPFLFSFEEWWAWWQIEDRWSRRGKGRGKLAMARIGDMGPYAPGNVYPDLHENNTRNMSRRFYIRAMLELQRGYVR